MGGKYPHPFVASFDGNQVGAATDILKDEPYESPMKPFGGIEQLAWSNDSKQIAYTCRKKTGLEYSVSTDSDIYLYNTETGETRNLCKEDATDKNLGYDTNPKFSPTEKVLHGKVWNATAMRATATVVRHGPEKWRKDL